MADHDALPSLTWEEAESRAALIDVERYDIAVDLTGLLEGDEFRAVATIRFRCADTQAAATSNAAFVDCAAEVVQVRLNDVDITDQAGHGRIPLSGLHTDNVVTVESVQRQTDVATGIHRFLDPSDDQAYVWTSFEPDDARRAWACFDQPDLKAPHAFTVTAPVHWTVISNSGHPIVEDVEDGRRWAFPDTPPLSTYVPVIDAGPFAEIRAQRDGYDLGLYARRSLAEFLERDAEELFDLTARGLAFYGERFALPFPQASYDQVFVTGMGGAMENYGCVTSTDQLIFRTPPSPQERQLRAQVLLHEMAHMWFGDMVTMRWWDDLWLNEAFAQFACCWAMTHATEYTDAWAGFLMTFKRLAYPADRGPTSHPIRQEAPDVATAAGGFDAITYQKGAAVLKQLMAYVGEDAFVDGLRSYFATHQWANARLADLIGAIGSASGQDLTEWTTRWLDVAGVDTLRLQRDSGAFVVHTEDPAGSRSAEVRPHRMHLGVYRADGPGRWSLRHTVPVQVMGPTSTAAGEGDTDDSDVVLVNDDDLTYAAVRPDASTVQTLLEAAAALPTAIGRAVAATTVWDMLMTGELSPASVVRCFVRMLHTESTDALVEPLLGLSTTAARQWSPDAARDGLLDEVAQVCLTIAEHGGARRQVAVRSLAVSAVSEQQLATLAELAGDEVDLQWRTQQRLAALGWYDEAAVADLQRRDPDPDAEARALAVRAAQPDSEAKEAAWSALMVQHSVPFDAMGTVSQAFWQPDQGEILRPFAERYLTALPELGGMGMLAAMGLSVAMFPYAGVDADMPERLTVAAQDPRVPATARQRVQEGADQLKRMLIARGQRVAGTS